MGSFEIDKVWFIGWFSTSVWFVYNVIETLAVFDEFQIVNITKFVSVAIYDGLYFIILNWNLE